MTRGNQRDHDRERAQKKAAANAKGPKQSGSSLKAAQEKNAEIMRQKGIAAAAKKAAEAAGGGAATAAKK